MDKLLISTYAQLAMTAYQPKGEAIVAYRECGYQAISVHESEHERDEGYLLLKDDQLMIAVRGSDDFADWVTSNLLLWRHWRLAHVGFSDAAYAIWRRIRPAIELYHNSNPGHPPILILGHSRGGAVGLHLAQRLHRLQMPVELCTFGAPRAAGKRWVDQARFSHCRVVHERDMVPHLPPMRLGYCHHGLPCVVGAASPQYGFQAWANLCRGIGGYRKVLRLLRVNNWLAAHRSYRSL